jgi:hypothetical protein
LGTICLGWLQTIIFPISASQVARITGMSHQSLAKYGLSLKKQNKTEYYASVGEKCTAQAHLLTEKDGAGIAQLTNRVILAHI